MSTRPPIERILLLFPLLSALGGCATEYSHYGRFVAENSAGEEREFLISWRTMESLSGEISAVTPVMLRTQCSDRKLVFMEPGQGGDACRAHRESGVVWCGAPGQDLSLDGKALGDATTLCGAITDENGASHIADLGRVMQLQISCWPAQTIVKTDDGPGNLDYIKASSVPYIVSVKRAEAGGSEDKPPALSETVCITD
ncbi:hypothetical protein HCH_04494 [Hahella chejuensis KCTC 2396]|uniref:Lipoprotein n=1 Tax=Hahella chejuensis (strain KCTC 2396) TaxID=349521 RepID=Q2SDS7_HAHCH|nr:hypothetical protein [Hahella chejuensis]ABC31197.1 hypothetical protein HCH_04494 [Hahella chejuensis KCTC 2396]